METKKSYIILGFIFLIGIILRVIVFGANNCYVHDDAALAINIVNKSYLELFCGLEFCQVAPPLFLIISKFVYYIVPKDYQIIDLCLKLLPFLSAIISIPLFYILSNLIFREKLKLYLANFIFTLNPLLICLSGRFKQYSTEVVIAILLYIIFYEYIIYGKWKKYWYFIIFLAPWISLSSLIILFSGIIIVFLKNKKIDKKILSVVLASVSLFLIVYLPSNLQSNYVEMNSFWSKYGFMNILHPQRLLIRLGELFLHEHKITETFLGLLVLYKIIEYIINIKQRSIIIFTLMPILVTIILSILHIYPFVDRLIAFLIPLFVIVITEYRNNIISKVISVNFILISFISLSITILNIYNLPNYRNNPAQYINSDKINKAYTPFYPVYKWYTHLEK